VCTDLKIIVTMIRLTRRAGMRTACKSLVGNVDGKSPFAKPSRILENSIHKNFKYNELMAQTGCIRLRTRLERDYCKQGHDLRLGVFAAVTMKNVVF
jgi:hypothetical protein